MAEQNKQSDNGTLENESTEENEIPGGGSTGQASGSDLTRPRVVQHNLLGQQPQVSYPGDQYSRRPGRARDVLARQRAVPVQSVQREAPFSIPLSDLLPTEGASLPGTTRQARRWQRRNEADCTVGCITFGVIVIYVLFVFFLVIIIYLVYLFVTKSTEGFSNTQDYLRRPR